MNDGVKSLAMSHHPEMTNVSINIDVDDLDQGVRFYEAALGLRPSRRFGPTAIQLEGAGVPVYLLEKAPGSAPSQGSTSSRTYDRHWTPVHLDFMVEDLEAAVRRAVAAGALAESPIESFAWGQIALMADPFGHGFCLLKLDDAAVDAASSPYRPR